MRASLIAYWAPKEGSSAAEYEDAWRVLPGPADELPGHWVAVAVADGATESLLARQWATMLVDEFALARSSARDARSFAETALALSARWPAVVEAYMTEREKAGRPLRWYERPGMEKGAFATLLALQMNMDIPPGYDAEPYDAEPQMSPGLPLDPGLPRVIGDWRSAAMGDTCLFHVRDGQLRVAFPLSGSGSFDTSPALLGSCDADPAPIMDHVRLAGGTVAEGDDFFVCTDAMAAWFLARSEEGGKPWETLRDLNEIRFAEWVDEARRTGGLHNDDVTLVHIDIW
ncbi:MAG: hypothetical protein ABSF03_28675 [Streptosporangiaceae bacterium]|jgi:hypothetical protein